jgi:hypothetical protein
MERCMVGAAEYLKVLDTVIGLDAIFVVNILGWKQWSSDMRFHDRTMFELALATYLDVPISVFDEPRCSSPTLIHRFVMG